jgi:hypothetical protein
LVRECKIMRTRVQAIVNCHEAISSLVAEDVFGSRYSALLKTDLRSLTDAISLGEKELDEVIEA